MGRIIAAVLVAFPLMLHAQTDPRDALLRSIDARRSTYADVAKQIWAFAEVGYQETKSSALLQHQLRAAGFSVRAGVADIPTAFVASFGSGKPVIAIIGEFDALPGLSQEPTPHRSAIVAEGAGHGCGHNLLGTAALASALAVKEWLAAGHPPPPRYYRPPPPESGSGEGYIVRARVLTHLHAPPSPH